MTTVNIQATSFIYKLDINNKYKELFDILFCVCLDISSLEVIPIIEFRMEFHPFDDYLYIL